MWGGGGMGSGAGGDWPGTMGREGGEARKVLLCMYLPEVGRPG